MPIGFKSNTVLALKNFANNLITFAKVQQIGANKLLGNATGSSANISELDIANYDNKLVLNTQTSNYTLV